MTETLPRSLFEDLHRQFEELSLEMGQLKNKLKRFSDSTVAFIALQLFEEMFQKYLKSFMKGNKSKASVGEAYLMFLNDENNEDAIHLRELLKMKPITAEIFADSCCCTYEKLSFIVRLVSKSFRSHHAKESFIDDLFLCSPLKVEEMDCIIIITKFLSMESE